MPKKKFSKNSSVNNVKVTDADVKKYTKRLTVLSKGKLIGCLAAGVALVGGGVGTAVYFGVNRGNGGSTEKAVDKLVITFDSDGGSKVNPVLVEKGKVATAPQDPVKDEYVFAGWFIEGTNSKFDFNTPITENVSLVAKWHLTESEQGLSYYYDENYEGYVVYRATDNYEEELPTKLSIPSSINGLPVVGIALPIEEDGGGAGGAEAGGGGSFEPNQTSYLNTASSVNPNNHPSSQGTGAFANTSITELEIPNSVLFIDASAFKDCASLKKVVLPKSCTYIGDNAFMGCCALSKIEFNEGLRSIGNNVFDGCSAIENIVLPNSLEGLGDYAFMDCKSLKTVHLNTKLKRVSYGAFAKCEKLSKINIPSSITTIESNAFSECKKLAAGGITFEDLSKWTDSYNDPTDPSELIQSLIDGNEVYKSTLRSGNFVLQTTGENPVKIDGRTQNVNTCTVYFDPKGAEITSEYLEVERSYTVDNVTYYVTGISDYCFEQCADYSSIIKIILPRTIKSIGNYAFAYNEYISQIQFASAHNEDDDLVLHSIGTRAFARTMNGNPGGWPLNFNSDNEYQINIPDSVEKIGDQAFSFRFADKVYISSNLSLMSYNHSYNSGYMLDGDGYNANPFFMFGTSIDGITISDDNVTFYTENGGIYTENGDLILQYAHSSSNPNDPLTIPDGAISINKYSFDTYKYKINKKVGSTIESISIPASVEYISESMYSLLNTISSDEFISIDTNNPYYTYDSTNKIVYALDGEDKISVEKCFVDKVTDNITLGDTIKEIKGSAFSRDSTSTAVSFDVTLNEGLEKIGKKAFSGFLFNSEIKIPSTVEQIGSLAFENSNIDSENLSVYVDSLKIANIETDNCLLFKNQKILVNEDINDYLTDNCILKTKYHNDHTEQGYVAYLLNS